jgi:hypothetical protein
MEARAAAIGAKISIESTPGVGTRITVEASVAPRTSPADVIAACVEPTEVIDD